MSQLQAKVTTKGQITLPKRIREKLSIESGDRIEFSLDDGNQVSLHRMQPAGSSAGCAKSYLKRNDKPLTREAERTAMTDAVGQKYGPQHG